MIRVTPALTPVVFDVVAPDRHTSLMPPELRLVLHVNPQSIRFTYKRVITRKQALRGHVLQHWGEVPVEMTIEGSSGGFMRIGTGITSVTGSDLGGSRRETIAYDKLQDYVALYRSNGAIYDRHGAIALQGMIRLTFDGSDYYGRFTSFSVTEDAQSPYQFRLSCAMTISHEQHVRRS